MSGLEAVIIWLSGESRLVSSSEGCGDLAGTVLQEAEFGNMHASILKITLVEQDQ